MVVFRYNDPNVAPEDKPTLAQKRRQQLERYSPNPKSYLVNAFPKSGMKKYDYVFIQTWAPYQINFTSFFLDVAPVPNLNLQIIRFRFDSINY